MKNKFNIDDKVWFAATYPIEKREVCPDCFGKKVLTVILGDDSRVSIDCSGCSAGYEPPRGYIIYWEKSTKVRQVIINRVEIQVDKIEYGFSSSCYTNEENLFFDKEDAEKRAKELAEIYNKEELDRISSKEKSNRTWAWNVHYYRKQIRDAENTIACYKAKLEASKGLKDEIIS